MTREERLNFWDRYFRGAYVKQLDICGAVMERDAQENTNTSWEVDHIFPEAKLLIIGVAQDKIDDDINLQPLNAVNNLSKGKNYPIFKYYVTSNGATNRNVGECVLALNHDKVNELNAFYEDEITSFIRKCSLKETLTEDEEEVMESLKVAGWDIA